ncbi:glutamyl-tRNA reductase [Robiginitalea myxolifaciens]|uniref:Glutamyl-tRNA reductase n=1 Tax=Robiginitalea myxolifaciens TaxID=400055 RepID=A0A1I6G0E3_9FLAO|nr:glutamyl-tRNA reductase [Robiginitalea myxolifaciens]SFR35665.1 glutamyl-tRNA reductase [Robiginitalea myxolifaciens]
MKKYHISRHHRFITIGLNFEKADAETRGRFALSQAAIDELLEQAREEGIDGLLVCSTCNRTELHGFAASPEHLIRLLCTHSHGTEEVFESIGYVYENTEAIAHLFRVGSGLDSQILGDFEIISQLKKSFIASKAAGIANPFLERLLNAVIQASKRVKNETRISSGATSVAFAAVQYLMARVPDIGNKRILLFGLGKIGRNTCENLVKHTGHSRITLINRTLQNAESIGGRFDLLVRPLDALQEEVGRSDVIIVATGSPTPTLTPEQFGGTAESEQAEVRKRWILDLSIPMNVDPAISDIDGVTRVHLDQLSQITDQTILERRKDIPKAEAIIEEVKAEFGAWLESRRFAPVIKALNQKLKHLRDEEIDFQSRKFSDFHHEQAEAVADRIIHKITRQFANHLKDDGSDTDESLEWIRKVFQLESDNS